MNDRAGRRDTAAQGTASRRQRVAEYPVFVVCRDRLTPLRALVAWLERVGQQRIVLVDNDSSYPPLLKYYRQTPHTVVRLGENLGHLAVWNASLLRRFRVSGRFVITDPDLVPVEECPDDAIAVLDRALDHFPDRVKAGFGLKIDDLPDHFPEKERVLAWERQFWATELVPGLYDADIDTTFALYQPGSPFSYGPSLRTGAPYLVRHTPWYCDPNTPSEEDRYYAEHVRPSISTWTMVPSSVESAANGRDTNADLEMTDAVERTTMPKLTIGMATYNDFDGVYFTIQSLRMHQDLEDTEILVVDNYGCEHTKGFVEGWARARYILAKDVSGTAAPRDLVFREAAGEAVLCCDSHVLFVPGAIARLKQYYRDHPGTRDLLQGPLLYDDLRSISTHFDPVWRDQMWGVWATDPRGEDPEGEPFDIPSQGLGAFSCRKDAWLGFNPAFRGFGGEEGYIHEKFRQAGARALCLPWLRWVHRFGRPAGVPYPLTVEDKFRNYVIGHLELGRELGPVLEHFSQWLSEERIVEVAGEAVRSMPEPAPADAPVAEPDGNVPPDDAAWASGITLYSRDLGSPESGDRGTAADLPMVSCICPTFNRAPSHLHLLEETVESFLRQTYPNKELIILNDAPGQHLVCDAPGVRVVNVSERFQSLGAKYNAAVAMSRGTLIAPWEDDDISLPHRLALSVQRLGTDDYYNPRRYWFLDDRGLHQDHPMGVGHNLSLFTKRAFWEAGGYQEISGAQDARMDDALRTSPGVKTVDAGEETVLPTGEWFYIYRWGVSPNHLSGNAESDRYYGQVGTQPVERGVFILHPHWRVDYAAEARRALHVEALTAGA